jgi:hypothetical protein
VKTKFCRFQIHITSKKGKETKIQSSNKPFAWRGSNSRPAFLKNVTEANCDYFSCNEQGGRAAGFYSCTGEEISSDFGQNTAQMC